MGCMSVFPAITCDRLCKPQSLSQVYMFRRVRGNVSENTRRCHGSLVDLLFYKYYIFKTGK